MVDPSHPRADGSVLEEFREYLRLLARLQLGGRFQGKIDASDIVQQTLLEAYRKLATFRGKSQKEMAAWLRQILAYNLSNMLRAMGQAKRDVRRERSLQAELDASSARLDAFLAADDSTPSRRVRQKEKAVLVAAALAKLSPNQREALILRHCHDLSLAEVGERLGIRPPAVVGLLMRGTRNLREFLNESS